MFMSSHIRFFKSWAISVNKIKKKLRYKNGGSLGDKIDLKNIYHGQ
jgi:hypothetical protein